MDNTLLWVFGGVVVIWIWIRLRGMVSKDAVERCLGRTEQKVDVVLSRTCELNEALGVYPVGKEGEKAKSLVIEDILKRLDRIEGRR